MGERGWLVSGIAADTGTVRFRWRRLGGEDDSGEDDVGWEEGLMCVMTMESILVLFFF